MSKMGDVYIIAQETAVKWGLDPNNNLIVGAIGQAYMDGRWDYIQEKWNA